MTVTGHPDVPATTTDALGRFLLSDQASRISSRPAWGIRWIDGDLVVDVARPDPVRLEILDASGRRRDARQVFPSSGSARFDLQSLSLRGVFFLRLRQGAETATWKMAFAGSASSGPVFRPLAGRAQATIDTLLVTKSGMTPRGFALPPGAGETSTFLESPLQLVPSVAGRMRFILEGRFRMGDTSLANAKPPIWRTVKAFWMDTVTATQAELAAMGVRQTYGDDKPAELNWFNAVRYCNARSLAEGLAPAYILGSDSVFWNARTESEGYRLPTEAEWEYAARAGTTTPWYWGDDTTLATIGQFAQYTGNTRGNPSPVASLRHNGFGLYDMAGNSWQWTDDMFGYYAADETQPVPTMQAYGFHRVFRGGAWYAKIDSLRTGFRGHDLPAASPYIGVRCVRTAFPTPPPTPAWSALPVSGSQRRIPGGSVRMGDSTQPAEALPVVERTVDDLWVDTVLVSAAEYTRRTGVVVYGDTNRPADINWYKAVRYCNARSLAENLDPVYSLTGDSTGWAADTTKNGYRLPSEAEWEYLARAGSRDGWWWGSDTSAPHAAQRAWWSGNSAGNAHPGAQKLPNVFGLYDMAGNFWQWTEDMFGLYKADGSKPTPIVFEFGVHRVYRGGAWFSPMEWLRSGRRKHDLGLANGYIGFRCVRSAK